MSHFLLSAFVVVGFGIAIVSLVSGAVRNYDDGMSFIPALQILAIPVWVWAAYDVVKLVNA